MIKIVTVEQMRAVEAAANALGLTNDLLMENAGTAVARRAVDLIGALPDPNDARVTVLVGGGNNGGDGLVAARVIAQNSAAQVRVYVMQPRLDDPHLEVARAAGLFIADAESDQRFRVLTNMIRSANIVIDSIYGIGVELPLRDEASKLLRAVRAAFSSTEGESENIEGEILMPANPAMTHPAARPYILAVDCPSGLDCDTGAVDRSTLHADETVTFIAVKQGLLMFPGAENVGSLTLATAGVPDNVEGLKAEPRFLVDADQVRAKLPARTSASHKGSYGKALIVGGSVNYTGAVGMAAQAAYRSGAGLVTVGAPAPVVATLASALLESTWIMLPHDMGVLSSAAAPMIEEEAEAYDALLIGCGINREKTTRDMLVQLLDRQASKAAKRTMGFGTGKASDDGDAEKTVKLPPLVIDADALNLLSDIDEWWKLLPENTIITPHAGELARLAKIERDEVDKNRFTVAAEKSAAWNCIVLLKGAHTLIASPKGQLAVLPFKTSALSTAGTGDVLAGMIVGLLAQGVAPFDAAVCAGYLHGLAGVEAANSLGGDRTVIAGDVIAHLATALRLVES